MKFKQQYKLNLWKAYFDKGLSLTNYFKYILAFFSLASRDVKLVLIIALCYALGCFFMGWWWYRYGWIKAEIEVQNRFNLFVKEMRKTIKG